MTDLLLLAGLASAALDWIRRTWRRRAALVLLLALLTPSVLAGEGLAEVARRMGCRLYVEPEVRLRSADVQGLSPEEALARLLPAGAEWRRVGDVLVVRRPTACWQHVPRDERWRLQDNWQEYRLERATRAEVVPLLRAEYPSTFFDELPTEEGFFVRGATRGIYREVKARLLTLDVPHPPTEPRPRVSLPIRHASAGAVASVLARILPEARIEVDAEVVSVEGSAEVRGWVVSLVELLDEDPPRAEGDRFVGPPEGTTNP